MYIKSWGSKLSYLCRLKEKKKKKKNFASLLTPDRLEYLTVFDIVMMRDGKYTSRNFPFFFSLPFFKIRNKKMAIFKKKTFFSCCYYNHLNLILGFVGSIITNLKSKGEGRDTFRMKFNQGLIDHKYGIWQTLRTTNKTLKYLPCRPSDWRRDQRANSPLKNP